MDKDIFNDVQAVLLKNTGTGTGPKKKHLHWHRF
jgi:hypothetical protein